QAIEAGPLFHPKAFHIVSEKSGNKIKFNKHKLKEFLQSKDGQKFLGVFFQALNKKNNELGIEKMYLQHIGDEAKPEERILYRQLVKIIHENMPGIPVIDATELSRNQRLGMMDIPVTNLAVKEVERNDAHTTKWGKWWYTTAFKPRGKMPNRFIDYPLVKMRMLSWLSWRYGVSGYLHYGYNWWQIPSRKSPWEQTQYKKYAAGDGWIVYPPKEKKIQAPVSSMRWESFRDGLEDYEYLVLLKKNVTDLKMALARNNNNAALKQMIERGESVLEDFNSSVVSKINYPRSSESVKLIRFKIGVWLGQVSQYFDGGDNVSDTLLVQ
ncbi:MAG TPA: DUF4091 domain-containing protein, partial [Gammaproteobacteria bacterium]|nr:DUF4091 domain-containing protein [Gammaproteobacteria bacterium]